MCTMFVNFSQFEKLDYSLNQEKTYTEIFLVLQHIYEEDSVCRSHCYQWY